MIYLRKLQRVKEGRRESTTSLEQTSRGRTVADGGRSRGTEDSRRKEPLTGVRSSEPRDTLTLEGSPVEREVGVENHRLIVLSSVLVEHVLGEEREALGVPGVGDAERWGKRQAIEDEGSVPRVGR